MKALITVAGGLRALGFLLWSSNTPSITAKVPFTPENNPPAPLTRKRGRKKKEQK